MTLVAQACCLNSSRPTWRFYRRANGTYCGERTDSQARNTDKVFASLNDLNSYLRWCTSKGWSVRRLAAFNA